MATVRLGVFPSIDNKTSQDQIAQQIVEWFVRRWPPTFFNNIFIDNQSNVANNYIINTDGNMVSYTSGQKIKTPNISFSFRQGANNSSDVFGTDIWNPNQQPGAFMIDTDLTGYRPVLIDPYGAVISLNERTIRNEMEITIKVSSKADQLALMNYLDTNLKMNYVQVIDTNTSLLIPRLMLDYYRNSLYKAEYKALERSNLDEDAMNQILVGINQEFSKHLYKYSENHIKPAAGSTDDYNFAYSYKQKHRVTARFEKYTGDDGNRRGTAYSMFSVSISGWIEYSNIISFITTMPAIMRGRKNDWWISTSSQRDKENYQHIMAFKEVFKDTRNKVPIDNRFWRHFYFEREILMGAKTETFNIIDDIISVTHTPSHYYIMKALLEIIKTPEEFNQLFYVVLYCEDDPVPRINMEIDTEFNITVDDCKLGVPYYLDVFISKYAFETYNERLFGLLNKWGITLNEDERNYKYGNDKLRMNEYFISKEGFGYIPTIYVGKIDKNGQKLEFLPIKQCDYIEADRSFKYYREVEDGYILVDYDKVESNSETQYYVQASEGDFIPVDWNKIMIPMKKYKFFTFDRQKDLYVYEENIEEFDMLTQYYILQDEYPFGDVLIYPDTYLQNWGYNK